MNHRRLYYYTTYASVAPHYLVPVYSLPAAWAHAYTIKSKSDPDNVLFSAPNMVFMNGKSMETPVNDFVLECHNLSYIRSFTTGRWYSKIFNPPITAQFLKDVSLELHGGEVMGVIGSSGSGKTTLLNVIARRVQGTTEIEQTFNCSRNTEVSSRTWAIICYHPKREIRESAQRYARFRTNGLWQSSSQQSPRKYKGIVHRYDVIINKLYQDYIKSKIPQG